MGNMKWQFLYWWFIILILKISYKFFKQYRLILGEHLSFNLTTRNVLALKTLVDVSNHMVTIDGTLRFFLVAKFISSNVTSYIVPSIIKKYIYNNAKPFVNLIINLIYGTW